MKKVLVAIGILSLPLAVQADSGDISIGGGIGIWDYDESGLPGFTLGSLELNAAYTVIPNLAFQANAGLGFTEETEIVGAGNELDLKIKNYLSLYLRPQLQLEDNALYALIGYSETRLEGSFDGVVTKDSADGMSYGIGAAFGLSESSSISVEWRAQAKPSSYDLTGFTIGYNVSIK